MATLTWTAQTGVNRGDETASGGRFRIIPRVRSARNKMDDFMLWDNNRVAWSTTTEHSRASVLRPRKGVIKRGTKKHLKYWAQRATDRSQAFNGPAARVDLRLLTTAMLLCAMVWFALGIILGCNDPGQSVATMRAAAAAPATPALNGAQQAIQDRFCQRVGDAWDVFAQNATPGGTGAMTTFTATVAKLRAARDSASHAVALEPAPTPTPGPTPPNPTPAPIGQ